MSLTDKNVNKAVPPPRRRRTPEASRENILTAAEQILTLRGPLELKLTEVAASAGIATATVLHHFGSVAALQAALMERMVTRLAARIIQIEAETGYGPDSGLRTAQALFDAFEDKGAARLAAWLEMTGEATRLSVVRRAVHDVLDHNAGRTDLPPRAALEEFALASITLALGAGLFGQSLSILLGLPPDAARKAVLSLLIERMMAARLY